jgi:hypothetical protein
MLSFIIIILRNSIRIIFSLLTTLSITIYLRIIISLPYISLVIIIRIFYLSTHIIIIAIFLI